MRVVHVVSHTGTYGGERFVPALARAQRAAGVDGHIVTIYDARPVRGVPCYSCGRRFSGRARGGGPLFFYRLLVLLRRLRPDVVHTHLAHAKYWGRLAAVLVGAPCIVHTEHANAFEEPWLKRILARALDYRTAAVVALSNAQSERIAEIEGVRRERLTVIPNGVEAAPLPMAGTRTRARVRAELGLQQRTRIVLAIGRLDPVKGYDLALETLALLPSEMVLVVAGDGPQREALLARAAELEVRDRFFLLGYRSDVSRLLDAADIVLNASRSEAMPLSVLEALCAGVPVVTTPWPGASELVDAQAVAASFDAAAIARALERAPAVTDRASAAKKARAHFSIERTAAAYALLYRDAAERGTLLREYQPVVCQNL